jgi:DNA-binding transcriptional LysR family regulator
MLNQIDLSRIDLNLLVLFEAVLQTRHVGRAAAHVNLTPSAISHGLGRLRRLLNDPLFLRTPRGVVPTERANALAAPIADILARVRGVVAVAEPFDQARSRRRFTIGAPDGASAVLLSPLLTALRRSAPGIDIGLRQLLPARGETTGERAWLGALAELEARAMDVAIIPTDRVPPRFHRRLLYAEEFVVAMRAGHPYAGRPHLDRYCAMQHVVVSLEGDPKGFVDRALAGRGRARRVVLTVPHFMLALAAVADSDLLTVLPRRFAARHAARLGVVTLEMPFTVERSLLNAVTPEAALMDQGVTWLLDQLERAGRAAAITPTKRQTRAK